MIRRPPRSTRTDTLFPYTTLFRSDVERPPRRRLQQRPALHLHQPVPLQRKTKRAPAHCRIFIRLVRLAQIGQRLVATDVERAEHHRPVSSEARRVGKECVSTVRSRGPPDHNKKKTTSTY